MRQILLFHRHSRDAASHDLTNKEEQFVKKHDMGLSRVVNSITTDEDSDLNELILAVRQKIAAGARVLAIASTAPDHLNAATYALTRVQWHKFSFTQGDEGAVAQILFLNDDFYVTGPLELGHITY